MILARGITAIFLNDNMKTCTGENNYCIFEPDKTNKEG
jgi:hypothetical protein